MANIIVTFFLLIITSVFLLYIIKSYKSAETLFEKLVLISTIFIIMIPIIVYYLDRYNIPSKIHYIDNIDVSNWYTFMSSYLAAISGSIISGIILIRITFKQLKIEDNRKKEELLVSQKVNNMPIFRYEFNSYSKKANSHILVMSEIENHSNDSCIVNFDVENIGLNTAKNISCCIKTIDNRFFCHSLDTIPVLKVGLVESFGLLTYFDFKKSKKRDIIVTFYYDDLFNNHYKQDISVHVEFKKSNDDFVEYEPGTWTEIRVEKQLEE